MSVVVGTIAGTTGLGSTEQAVQLLSGDLWLFQFTGTQTLSSWYSQDQGQTWTAGATHSLSHAHNSEGRNLGVCYRQDPATGVDVVYAGIIYKSGTSLGATAIRATISGPTITWHATETAVSAPTGDGDSLFWSGSGLRIDTAGKVHFAAGWTGGGNGDVNSSDSTVDPGTVESSTPVTWTAHVIDSSVSAESRSFSVFDLGSGNVGLIADDGSAAATTTGLDWHHGLPWNIDNTNQKVTGGAITAIDRNDWGGVKVSPTDVHAVYLDSGGNLVHRRYNGTTWGAGQTIPSGPSPASGTGVALCSDGVSVWLIVLDTDPANTVMRLGWSSIATNGIQDAWDSSWQAVESSSATRSWVGCARDVVNQVGLVYWTEGTNLVAAPFPAVPPTDPLGAWVQSAQGSTGVAATTFAVAFTTQNVVAGNRIIVKVDVWNSTATTVTSVTDSASNAYVKDNDEVLSDGTHVSHWSAPITAGGGTKPTVTAHASASTAEWDMFVHEVSLGGFDNRTSGYVSGKNKFATSAASSPITSGAAAPVSSISGEFAFGSYGDGGNNIATIGVSAGWTQRGTSIQGTSTTCQGACASQPSVAGVGSNASFTLSSGGSAAGVLVTVYSLVPVPGGGLATQPLIPGPPTLPFNPQILTYWQAWPTPIPLPPASLLAQSPYARNPNTRR